MSNHIHYLHNKTDGEVKVEKNQGGRYSSVTDIPAGKSGGPFDNHDLSELKFVFKSSRPVYFKFVKNEKKDDIKHIDGETGHPDSPSG